jgi:uncharacterized protein YcnI
MRTIWFRFTALSVCLTLVATGVAWAHVRVVPEEVSADSFLVLTVRVPTEKDVPTTEVRVEIPEGFTISRVKPVPDWEYEFEEEAGVVRAITWSGGEIGATEFQEFDVQGETPEEPGEYPWRAFQTYEDGSVVEWAGPEDSEEPASVVTVAEGDHHGAAAQGSNPEEAPSVGAVTPVAAYGNLGALALVAALAALLLLLLRRNR